MFAIVDAEMSTRLRAPRCSRSGASGVLVSENGVEAVSLMSTPPIGRRVGGGNGLLTAIVPRRRGGRQPAFSVREANWIPASTPASPPGELLDLGITPVGAGRPDLSHHLRGTFLRPLRQGLSQLAASYLTRHWHARADYRKYGDHTAGIPAGGSGGGRGLVLSRRTTSPGTGMIRGRSAPGSPRTRVAAISPIVFSGST